MRVLDSASGVGTARRSRLWRQRLSASPSRPTVRSSRRADDGQLRRYGPDLKLTAKRAAPDGKRPLRRRDRPLRPAGRDRLSTMRRRCRSSTRKTLAPLAKAQTSDLGDGDLLKRRLVARRRDARRGRDSAGAAPGRMAQYPAPLRRERPTPGRRCRRVRQHNHGHPALRRGLRFCGRRSVVRPPLRAGRRDDSAGPAHGGHARQAADRRFAISRDASSVRFGLGYGEEKPVVFDLAAASLTDSPNLPSDFAPARVDGLPVTDWKNNYAAEVQRRETRARRATSVPAPWRFGRDASGFVLGTELVCARL